LAPWHPSAYAQFQETSIGRLAILAEAKYREIAAKSGIRVVGSFDPGPNEVDARDFVDQMHLKKPAMDKSLQRLLPLNGER
ncbi:hypothetical protein WDZ92_53820, partial [Nostoc sp. NIES-2111]